MRHTTTDQLCYSYAFTEASKIRDELVRRHAFTEADWAAIGKHDVFVGMSRDAVKCALGPSTHVERTESGAEAWSYYKRRVILDGSQVQAIESQTD